jgi:hypothetical protein
MIIINEVKIFEKDYQKTDAISSVCTDSQSFDLQFIFW